MARSGCSGWPLSWSASWPGRRCARRSPDASSRAARSLSRPMRQVRIHDTLSGEVRTLDPREPPKVGIYACGPTVYGRIHVGNARPYVVFALLKRFLEHEGYESTFVANVTDVNDKIYDAARDRGVPSEELAEEMTAAYIEDTEALGLGRPDAEPKASETIEAIVGVDFEIHGGGSDLVFPHHENEIAQTEAARGKPLARLWMHNGMVEMDDEKMAKSVGNIRLLHGALEQFGREAFVMWIVGAHYRKPVAYTEEAMEDAARAVSRVRDLVRRLDREAAPSPDLDELAERFFDELADDFNTAAARGVLFEWVAEANRRVDAGERVGHGRLGEMLHAFGLESLLEEGDVEAPEEIQRLAAARGEALAPPRLRRAGRLRGRPPG